MIPTCTIGLLSIPPAVELRMSIKMTGAGKIRKGIARAGAPAQTAPICYNPELVLKESIDG